MTAGRNSTAPSQGRQTEQNIFLVARRSGTHCREGAFDCGPRGTNEVLSSSRDCFCTTAASPRMDDDNEDSFPTLSNQGPHTEAVALR